MDNKNETSSNILHLQSKDLISEGSLSLLLLFLDLAVLVICYYASCYLRLGAVNTTSVFDFVFLSYAFLVIITLYMFDLYKTSQRRSKLELLVKIGISNLISSISVIPIVYFVAGLQTLENSLIGRGILAINFFLFTATALIYRYPISQWYLDRTEKLIFLLIGPIEILEEIRKGLEKKKFKGQIIFSSPDITYNQNAPKVFSWDQLDMLLNRKWTQVIVAEDTPLPDDLSKKLMHKRFSGQSIADLTEFYERFFNKVPLFYLKERWFVSTQGFNLVYSEKNQRLKRFMDLLLSTLILIPAVPIFLLVSILIFLFGGKGPIFYKQKRVGEHGKIFDIYKFRTMIAEADKLGTAYTQKNDPRITKIGKILRFTRIDELPQLLNILRGEMNLIGPRPEAQSIDDELKEKIPFYSLKYAIKPGITGWTQINCENGSTLQNSIERIQYDIFYLKNYSPFMDLRIVVSTIKVVLFGKGSR